MAAADDCAWRGQSSGRSLAEENLERFGPAAPYACFMFMHAGNFHCAEKSEMKINAIADGCNFAALPGNNEFSNFQTAIDLMIWN